MLRKDPVPCLHITAKPLILRQSLPLLDYPADRFPRNRDISEKSRPACRIVGHRPRRRRRGSSGPLGSSGFRCRLPRWRTTAARHENPPPFGPRCATAVRGDHSFLPDDTPVPGSGCCRSLESRSPAVEVAAWDSIPAAFGSLLLSPAAAGPFAAPSGHDGVGTIDTWRIAPSWSGCGLLSAVLRTSFFNFIMSMNPFLIFSRKAWLTPNSCDARYVWAACARAAFIADSAAVSVFRVQLL
nr:uncharacterized protein LOC118879623 [Drosophila suzukii]